MLQKTSENSSFFKVFTILLFGSFCASLGHLGFSCKSLLDFVQKPWSILCLIFGFR